MAALARTYAGDAGRPVWLQEFGASSRWMEEAQIPAFLEAATHAALAGGIGWVTWWASHDIFAEVSIRSVGVRPRSHHYREQKSSPPAKSFVASPANMPASRSRCLRCPFKALPRHDAGVHLALAGRNPKRTSLSSSLRHLREQPALHKAHTGVMWDIGDLPYLSTHQQSSAGSSAPTISAKKSLLSSILLILSILSKTNS